LTSNSQKPTANSQKPDNVIISKLVNVRMWEWHKLELPLQGADGFGVFSPEALLRVEVSCPFGASYTPSAAFVLKQSAPSGRIIWSLFLYPRRCHWGEMICPFGARAIQYDAFEAQDAGLKALLNGNGVELQIQCCSERHCKCRPAGRMDSGLKTLLNGKDIALRGDVYPIRCLRGAVCRAESPIYYSHEATPLANNGIQYSRPVRAG